MTDDYNDIINLPHPTSKKHPRMSLYARAAQFSPFAALTGYEDAVKETARLTDRKIEHDEDTLSRLNAKLNIIDDNLGTDAEIRIIFFVPDERKEGGSYQKKSGVVKRIDEYEGVLMLTDGTKIPIEQIYEMEGKIFSENGVE